jgi:hypothetical protein
VGTAPRPQEEELSLRGSLSGLLSILWRRPQFRAAELWPYGRAQRVHRAQTSAQAAFLRQQKGQSRLRLGEALHLIFFFRCRAWASRACPSLSSLACLQVDVDKAKRRGPQRMVTVVKAVNTCVCQADIGRLCQLIVLCTRMVSPGSHESSSQFLLPANSLPARTCTSVRSKASVVWCVYDGGRILTIDPVQRVNENSLAALSAGSRQVSRVSRVRDSLTRLPSTMIIQVTTHAAVTISPTKTIFLRVPLGNSDTSGSSVNSRVLLSVHGLVYAPAVKNSSAWHVRY